MPGQVVSHYRLLNPLGSGGMGVVYRAEDTELGRQVALKFLPETRDHDARHMARLKEEARTASALNHPHICTIYEVGESDGEIYIAMEYVEGRPLSDEIRGTGLSVETLLRYGRQIAAALEHAHERGVVHRDLKPVNIRITPAGDAKVLDFGLAVRTNPATVDPKTLDTVPKETSLGLAGTMPYMAPEQLQGGESGPRSDLWSFGVVLYEMAAGHRPFRGESFYGLCTSILQEAPPPLPGRIPAGLAGVIRRCLEKDPARRYQRASEVRAAPEALEPSSAFAGPAIAPARPRWMKWTGAVGIALLAAAGYFGWTRWRDTTPVSSLPSQIQLAVLPPAPTSQDPSATASENGVAETLTVQLTKLTEKHALAVIPMSEMRAKGVRSLDEAREQFGVNLALVLSFQRVAQRVRVNYSLVDARTHRQLGGGTITTAADDPFALQDQVAASVTKTLELELQPQEFQALGAHGTAQPVAYDYYLQGRGYLQDLGKIENVENAVSVLTRALEQDRNFADAHAGLGEAYWRKYELTHDSSWVGQATSSCERAVQLQDEQAAGHICLGLVYNGTGKYEQAVEQYRKAAQLDPTNDAAHSGLARAYEGLGRLGEAEATYRKAIALRQNYWAGYNWLGRFYLVHGRLAEAGQMFAQVVSLAPDSFIGYSNQGITRVLEGRYAEAIPLLERSLGIRETGTARSNLATAYFFSRRYADAARLYEKAAATDSQNYELWGNLADAYYWAPGLRERAPEAYRKAIALAEAKRKVNPRDVSLLGYLAGYHAALRERRAARDTLDAALKLAPKDPDLLYNAAIVYQQFGETGRAVEALERAVAGGFSLPTVRDSPNFDSLHDNPRFLKLVSNALGKEGRSP